MLPTVYGSRLLTLPNTIPDPYTLNTFLRPQIMEADPNYASHSNMLRSPYAPASGIATFKLDEGFSEDPRGQDEGDLAATSDNTSGFEEWVMAQSEDARAGGCSHT